MVQHPRRLGALTRKDERYTHEGGTAVCSCFAQGSSPNLGPSGKRKSILGEEAQAYSWSKKPQSPVSTRTSSLGCISLAHFQSDRACHTEIRSRARIAISRSLVS